MKTSRLIHLASAALAPIEPMKARLGIGGSCTPRMSPDAYGGGNCSVPPQVSGCERPGRPCDLGQMGTTQLVLGGSPFVLTIEPEGAAWFQTVSVQATVVDADNSDLVHRVLFTAVRIGNNGMEAFDDTSPTAPAAAGDTINGVWSDAWATDDENDAYQVNWGWSSIQGQSKPLRIHGIALGLPATTRLLVSVKCRGNASDMPGR
jgi:hypothetical protein